MAAIDPRYTPEEWENIIQRYMYVNEDGIRMVSYKQMYHDYGIQSINTPTNLTGAEIQDIVNQGYDGLSLTVEGYYNINGQGPSNHEMKVNQVRYVPDKYVKLRVSDWGHGFYDNGVYNYNKTYKLGNTRFNPLHFTFFK